MITIELTPEIFTAIEYLFFRNSKSKPLPDYDGWKGWILENRALVWSGSKYRLVSLTEVPTAAKLRSVMSGIVSQLTSPGGLTVYPIGPLPTL